MTEMGAHRVSDKGWMSAGRLTMDVMIGDDAGFRKSTKIDPDDDLV